MSTALKSIQDNPMRQGDGVIVNCFGELSILPPSLCQVSDSGVYQSDKFDNRIVMNPNYYAAVSGATNMGSDDSGVFHII